MTFLNNFFKFAIIKLEQSLKKLLIKYNLIKYDLILLYSKKFVNTNFLFFGFSLTIIILKGVYNE